MHEEKSSLNNIKHIDLVLAVSTALFGFLKCATRRQTGPFGAGSGDYSVRQPPPTPDGSNLILAMIIYLIKVVIFL